MNAIGCFYYSRGTFRIAQLFFCLLFGNQNLLGYKILKFKYSFVDSLESIASTTKRDFCLTKEFQSKNRTCFSLNTGRLKPAKSINFFHF